MENNLENKAKFFTQYFGVKCMSIRKEQDPELYVGFDDFVPKEQFEKYYLNLTPLSSIADEDVNHINYTDVFIEILRRGDVLGLNIYSIDYLRSKGYALPYMGLSVEKLVEYGWIKLRTNAGPEKTV